jgi:hypothetical protein
MPRVQASLILALTHAALVTVAPSPVDQCPSSVQVQAALENHAAKLLAPRPDEGKSGPLTLVLSPALATGETSFFLIDKNGLVKLYRTMPPPPGDRARDCAALADTVAFIVERYFDEVEMPMLPEHKPPPEPPKEPPLVKPAEPMHELRSYALSFIVGRRIPGAAENLGGIEFKLQGGARLTGSAEAGRGHLWLDLSAGIGGKSSWSVGNINVVRYVAETSLLGVWPALLGDVYIGPVATGELVSIDATLAGRDQHWTRLAGALGVRAGYIYSWHDHLFIQADVSGHPIARKQAIYAEPSDSTAIITGPSTYLTMALGVGIWF